MGVLYGETLFFFVFGETLKKNLQLKRCGSEGRDHFVTWVVNVGVVFPTPSLSGFCAFCDDPEVDSVFTAVKEHDRSSPCPTTVSLFCPMTSLALLGWSPQIVKGMDFCVGKKIHHHFQMTSWHLWGTTT